VPVSTTVEHYTGSESGPVERVLAALEQEGLGGELTVDDIGPLADFHTAGRAATFALADAARLREGMRVLDVGAGVGGPALVLAAQYGCTVTALDLTPDFCRLARILAERTGLADRVTVVEGDALALPFEDASFDAAWTHHVQMNIADKPALYRGIRRVLRPGGTFAFWEIVSADGSAIHFPVPWASEPSQSFLAGYDEVRELVRAAGFEEVLAEDGTEEAHAFVALIKQEAADGAPPPLGLHLIIPDVAARVAGVTRNFDEGKLRVIRGVYRAV
jgi:SAM-dependent methyltransferase